MLKEEALQKKEQAKKGETTVPELMEVLIEFYLSFSKHIKEIKDDISEIQSTLNRQEQELSSINDRIRHIESTVVNPIYKVNLHRED